MHGIAPDLSTWGKGIANGFPLAALAGRRAVMELGGLHHDRERVFLLSTTHGAEHAGLAAGLATMAVYREEPVVATMLAQGERLRAGLQRVIAAHGIGHASVSSAGRLVSTTARATRPESRRSHSARSSSKRRSSRAACAVVRDQLRTP